MNGEIQNRQGNRSDYAVPHGIYRCKGDDSWCAITVFTEAEWNSLCRVMVDSPACEDPRFATFRTRKENEDELDKIIDGWTINYSAPEVVEILQAQGIAAGMVEANRDLLDDPQLKHRNYFHRVEHLELGSFPYSGIGFDFSRTPVQLQRSPCLGEDNEFVCTEMLGLSDDEFIELLTQGVLK